jgi:hypothetical protein
MKCVQSFEDFDKTGSECATRIEIGGLSGAFCTDGLRRATKEEIHQLLGAPEDDSGT